MNRVGLFLALVWSTNALAGPGKRMIEGALGQGKLPELEQVLTERGWTMVPDRSGTYKPGDIYNSELQSVFIFGEDCFEGTIREGNYPSKIVEKALEIGGKVPLGFARVEARGKVYKQLTFAEPYVEERAISALYQPNDECQEDLLLKNNDDLDKLFAIQSILFAEVKEQLCTDVVAKAKFAGMGADVQVSEDCSQASEGHVAVAYKTIALMDILQNRGLIDERGGIVGGTMLDQDGTQTTREAQKQYHVVKFETAVPGAVVRVGGQLACPATPCSAEVKAGRHSVMIEQVRYEAHRQKIEVPKDKRVRATLKPKFGWLQVVTSGDTVDYSINGSPAEHIYGQKMERWPGAYEVSINDPCYRPSSVRVTLQKGKTQVAKLNPSARLADIDLVATDGKGNALDAQVFLSGERVGGNTPVTFPASVCTGELEVRYRNRSARYRPTLKEDETVYLEAVFQGLKAFIHPAEQQRFRQGEQEVARLLARGLYIQAVIKATELTTRYPDRAEPWRILGEAHKGSRSWQDAWLAYRRFLAKKGPISSVRRPLAEVESHLISLRLGLQSAAGQPSLVPKTMQVRLVGSQGVDEVAELPQMETVGGGARVGINLEGLLPGANRLHIIPGPNQQPFFVPLGFPGGTTQKLPFTVGPVQSGQITIGPFDSRLSLMLIDAQLRRHPIDRPGELSTVRGSATMRAQYGKDELRYGVEVGDGAAVKLPWAYRVETSGQVLKQGLMEPHETHASVRVQFPLDGTTVPVEGTVRGGPGKLVVYKLDPRKHPVFEHSRALQRLSIAGRTNRFVDWGLGAGGGVASLVGGIQLISSRVIERKAAQIIDPAQVDEFNRLEAKSKTQKTVGIVGLTTGGGLLLSAGLHYFLGTKKHQQKVRERRARQAAARKEAVGLEDLRR